MRIQTNSEHKDNKFQKHKHAKFMKISWDIITGRALINLMSSETGLYSVGKFTNVHYKA